MKKKKKRISTQSAKAKGRRLQQWAAQMISDLIRIAWGKDKLIASREMGQSGTDVRLVDKARRLCPWSVECKAQESWSVPAWIRQAQDNQLPNTDWLLIMKRSREKPVVVLDANVFFELLSLLPNDVKGRIKNET